LTGGVRTINENADALVAVSTEIGLDVDVGKTKYMVTTREQNAGICHKMKIDNRIIGMVEEFKYLGITLKNQNSINPSAWSDGHCPHAARSFVYISTS